MQSGRTIVEPMGSHTKTPTATNIAEPITSQIARARLAHTTMGGRSKLPCMRAPPISTSHFNAP